MLFNQASCQHKELASKLQVLQTTLSKLPDGKLICSKNGDYYKWYKRDSGGLHYIPKSQRILAEQLAEKTYLSLLFEDILHEKKALNAYLKRHSSYPEKASALLADSSGFQELLMPYFHSFPDALHVWQNSPYERNTNHPEQLIHKTLSGNTVRSKSESLIDTSLFLNKLPYRYECALQLGELHFFPDFTIFHPETRKIFYWEHFGMMDDASYSKNTYSKLQIYSSYGIIPSINLITTFETRKHPLTSESVEKVIHFFLK